MVGAAGPVMANPMPVVAVEDWNVSSQVKKYARLASSATCSFGAPLLPLMSTKAMLFVAMSDANAIVFGTYEKSPKVPCHPVTSAPYPANEFPLMVISVMLLKLVGKR